MLGRYPAGVLPLSAADIRAALTLRELSVLWAVASVGTDPDEIRIALRRGKTRASGAGLSLSTIAVALETIRLKLLRLADSGRNVTIVPQPPLEGRSSKMSEQARPQAKAVDRPPVEPAEQPPATALAERMEDFQERIYAPALAEAQRIGDELEALRKEAAVVGAVFEALGLQAPPALATLLGRAAEAAEAPAPEPPAPAPPAAEVLPPAPPVREEPPPTPAPSRARRAPQAPGIEAIPEELRRFPVAAKGGPVQQRIRTARLQQAIVADVLDHQPVVSGEVAARVDATQDTIARQLGELAEAGLIRKTGRLRLPAGRTTGKRAIEFAGPEGSLDGGALDARVRDWVRGRRDRAFTTLEVGAELGLTEAEAEAGLQHLQARQVVVPVRIPQAGRQGGSLAAWRYQKPTEPGAAADFDRQRRPTTTNGRDAAEPVAGTGRRFKNVDPQVVALITACERQQAQVNPTDDGQHFMIRTPSGQTVLLAAKARNQALAKTQAQLRRAGLQV